MLPPPSAIATPMAHGDGDDRPHRRLEARGDARRARVVAGPVRAASAISCTGLGLGRREVLGDAAGDLREHEAGDDGAEHAPARRCETVPARVADVDERDDERAEDGEDAGGEEATVDRRHRRLVLARSARTDEDADDRGEHADGTAAEREEQRRSAHSSGRPGRSRWKAGTPRMIDATSVTS